MDKLRPEVPFLGCYIIVRDAEKTIGALLESIKGVFDEIVIVDTGSSDRTRDVVARSFSFGYAVPGWPSQEDRSFLGYPALSPGGVRIVFAHFNWVDDFSAARNFAFGLGSARWRMYLDADDIFDQAREFRQLLERTDKMHPEADCVALKYEYVPHEMPQDVIRCVRWGAGWKWEEPLHEHLAPVGHSRHISKYPDIWVRHRPGAGHSERSFERNIRIAEKAYGEAKTAHKRALWAYYLADYAAELKRDDEARGWYREAADGLGLTNLACHALARWARLELRHGDAVEAVSLASEALGRAPELPDGLAVLGVAYASLGRLVQAESVFDALKAKQAPALESIHDAVFLDGIARTHAASVALGLGQIEKASEWLASIPPGLREHPEVRPLLLVAHRRFMQAKGLEALRAAVDFYLWDTQPLRALWLLEHAPAAIAHLPRVAQWKREVQAKLPQLPTWENYKKAYASIPAADFHTDDSMVEGVKKLGRTKAVVEWAKSLALDGPPVHVLTIGAQDCVIEAEVMQQNPRIFMLACDVGPQAARGIQALAERFPGRVATHEIVKDHLDWAPPERLHDFDAIFMFEVLEHLPDPGAALRVLSHYLSDEGTLFLSTPFAEAWVEPHLTDSKLAPTWYGHIHAFNPLELHVLLSGAGFRGDLFTTDGDAIFLARVKQVPLRQLIPGRVTILVPSGQSFDPLSLEEGHLGGSEEAVVHLSAALAERVSWVTVYSDTPARDGARLRGWKGVLWRPLTEFDPGGEHGELLVWRSPAIAAQLAEQAPLGTRVWNWLHDTHYEATAKQYGAVAGTIVLSAAHAGILTELELPGARGIRIAQNGIDLQAFPQVTDKDEDARNLRRVVYTSSPDRGLVHLLRMWRDVRAEVPTAELDIFYSWEGLERRIANNPEFAKTGAPLLAELQALLEDLEDEGVTYRGGVSHSELHAALRGASLWAYPTDFFEISCISAMKAQAAGCWPVTVQLGALAETVAYGSLIEGDIGEEETQRRFRVDLTTLLKLPPPREERAMMVDHARRIFPWQNAAQSFLDILGIVQPQQPPEVAAPAPAPISAALGAASLPQRSAPPEPS